VAGVVVLAGVAVALYLVVGPDGGSTVDASADRTRAGAATVESSTAGPMTAHEEPGSGAALPDATVTPEGLGNVPVLDVLARACYGGDMQSCDDLFDRSDAGSDYETYGDTCAGRQPTGTLAYCTDTFPQD
jgi:hypothetical protein